VLNDLAGQFGLAYNANPIWTGEPDNPSINSATGFPMCIPRNAADPLCPAKNGPINLATGTNSVS
jgi:hypothetical protein